ncbi:type II secretion system protein [bacterium]|nr:type II secretion system protein [bacterium]
MKIKAFTLYETLTVMVIIGVVATICLTALRPAKIKEEALMEAGKAMYMQVDYATREIIAKETINYTLERILNGANEYSIAQKSNLSTLVNTTYKKRFKTLRKAELTTEYKNLVLRTRDNSNATGESLTASSFTGFITKNEGYFGVRLHGGCTKSETYLYNPMLPDKRTQSNSCGQIFFDVNADTEPNLLGVDQYIVSLKVNGVR